MVILCSLYPQNLCSGEMRGVFNFEDYHYPACLLDLLASVKEHFPLLQPLLVRAMHNLAFILQEKVLRSQTCIPDSAIDSDSFLAYEMWLPEGGKIK